MQDLVFMRTCVLFLDGSVELSGSDRVQGLIGMWVCLIVMLGIEGFYCLVFSENQSCSFVWVLVVQLSFSQVVQQLVCISVVGSIFGEKFVVFLCLLVFIVVLNFLSVFSYLKFFLGFQILIVEGSIFGIVGCLGFLFRFW